MAHDILASLRDIHLPPPIVPYSLYILFGLLGFLIMAMGIVFLRYRLRHRIKRSALRELRQLEKQYRSSLTPLESPVWIATLVDRLRRVACHYFPANVTQSVTPTGLMAFLASLDTEFDNIALQKALSEGPYRKEYPIDTLPLLLARSRRWIQQVR